jgi:glycosyltransferase involved in cell wall biosynthesis
MPARARPADRGSGTMVAAVRCAGRREAARSEEGPGLTFTVAITVWRREHFLPHAIQSVLAQTWRDWELLVYSDGRSRAMRTVVERLQADFPISWEEVKRGWHRKGNRLRRLAIEQARGSHLCILSHDSYFYPTYLATHAANLRADPEAVSVVPVAYWKGDLRKAGHPKNHDMLGLTDGEIDLTCIAFPTRLARELDCFGPATERLRYADFLAFDALRRATQVVFHPGPEQAAHF